LNRIQQILIAEWLSEELDCSRLHGADSHGDISMGSDEDDGNMNVTFSQVALKVEPTYAG